MPTAMRGAKQPTVGGSRPAMMWLRGALLLFGALNLVWAAGFFWQLPWAIGSWPWPDGRLSYTFVAAIIAAIAAALIWLGATGEFRPMAAGALSLIVMMGGMSLYLWQLYARRGEETLLVYALATAAIAIVNLFIFLWAHRLPVRDLRPTPRPVLYSYALFCLVLTAVALALFWRLPTVMPWPLNADTSILIGCIFLGNAAYFLYALLYRRWYTAAPQLWSFLAYDVVLIGRLVMHANQVAPEHLPSLIVYTAVLLFSGGLAIYYLFIHRQTRLR
jgi:hypothetical protein